MRGQPCRCKCGRRRWGDSAAAGEGVGVEVDGDDRAWWLNIARILSVSWHYVHFYCICFQSGVAGFAKPTTDDISILNWVAFSVIVILKNYIRFTNLLFSHWKNYLNIKWYLHTKYEFSKYGYIGNPSYPNYMTRWPVQKSKLKSRWPSTKLLCFEVLFRRTYLGCLMSR